MDLYFWRASVLLPLPPLGVAEDAFLRLRLAADDLPMMEVRLWEESYFDFCNRVFDGNESRLRPMSDGVLCEAWPLSSVDGRKTEAQIEIQIHW